MTNEQMKAGRFLKMAKGRKLFARMVACWKRGGFVRVGTATQYTDIKAKNAEVIVLGKSGSLYMMRGKKPQCLDFCNFQFTA